MLLGAFNAEKNKDTLMYICKLIVVLCFSAIFCSLKAQTHPDQVYVDENGVMRWSVNDSELHGFGVNYTLPFAHEYRMALKTGIPLEDLIRQDVYHMARLDFDLYRVHVWDTEISDTLGNLISNEHLRLFDFAVNEMKQRGMNFIITPIAYWGNGWPERDESTPGFSGKYGKDACLTNEGAIEAQANYLSQFLNHVNPYTGIAYKDDPNIIGFEVSNEPHHNGAPEKVTSFINKMVASMRQTGCTKPIFYNLSLSNSLTDAYLNANIQGGTFQWYPTNLVANHQINGNFLPHVETYRIPFADRPEFKKMAKIVYEFDPADVGGNIMYPAMAVTFRETGMQLATQFAYDATCDAPYNTNYGTHFMNLAYAPQKAISLKIASAIFHNVPMYQKHSDITRFDAFRISYPDDLAEWVTDEKFFYSNNTTSQPKDLSQLKEIAGCGSSPVIKYSGTGAYFLDKLMDGVWRLEVMPDAYWIDDPYSIVNPNKQKTAVLHSRQQMKISLPDLGNNFTARPINNGNTFSPLVSNLQFDLVPGVYLLRRRDITNDVPVDFKYKNIRINEFAAPESNLRKTVLLNHSPAEALEGKPVQVCFEAESPSQISKIDVVMSIGDKWKTVTAVAQSTNSYKADVPDNMLVTGFLNYRVIVADSKGTTIFPNGGNDNPWSWVNHDNVTYTIRLVPENSPLIIWDAETDWEPTYKIWNPEVVLKPTNDGGTALAINMKHLPDVDPVNKDNRNYAFKFYFKEKIIGRYDELSQKKFLVVKASDYLSLPQPIEVGLIDKNGSVLAGEMVITPEKKVFRVALSTFKTAQFLIIPRPFPEFLPYTVQSFNKSFDWSSVETLQLIVKPGREDDVNLNIEKIWLE
jgi:hypothetical protein